MENGGEKMGASTANNQTRIAALQERKRQIEETLSKRTQELRQLCIQEAELTGFTPPEMPLEPGETLPMIRRKVGTSYQLPENLLENNKDEMIAELELQIKLHANMAEAALGLANEQGASKTIKRQHKNEYQKHKQQVALLQEKLDKLKEKEQQMLQQQQQHKMKKKQPRTVEVEPFQKNETRHSSRSLKYAADADVELRHSCRYPDTSSLNLRQDDLLSSGIYRLSLNGYNRYMERREHYNNHYQQQQHSPYNSNQHYSQYSPQTPNFYPNYPVHYRTSYNYYQEYTTPSPYYPSSTPSSTSPMQYHDYRREETPSRQTSSQVLQPHQQYETMSSVVSIGLGGCWKQNEHGELVWANSTPDNWQYREKKPVLDRRKKKLPKQRGYLTNDNKSATLGPVHGYHCQGRNNVKTSPTHGGQLVRTQSLGSVGAHTVDSVYPSDDASSCGSENRSLRRNKEKSWTETSLDSPVLAPEDKYRNEEPVTPPPLPPHQAKVLEIPAESKPSPSKIVSEPNIEFFNNNIPRNGTVVQAGQCKPYREETKPFEMSDFYKYSTKFKRSPSKNENEKKNFDDVYNSFNGNVSRV